MILDRTGSNPVIRIGVIMDTQILKLVVNRLGERKFLHEIPTRQLLEIYRGFYPATFDDFWDNESIIRSSVWYAIKAELAKREHIPNKKEAKLLRKKKALRLAKCRNKNR